jgi:hypothetical protein
MQQNVVLVTGTIHVEGGEENSVRQNSSGGFGDSEMIQITQQRKITPDRRAANVISTGYMRRLRKLRLARTPYGHLVDRRRLPEVRALIEDATRDVAAFNGSHTAARLVNTFLWEPFTGNRAAAVAGWLSAESRRDSATKAKTILGWLQGRIELPEAAA